MVKKFSEVVFMNEVSVEAQTADSQSSDDKMVKGWVCLSYVAGVLRIFPFSSVVLPLILWLVYRKSSELIDKHCKNVLNFAITWAIVNIMFWIATFASVLWPLKSSYKATSYAGYGSSSYEIASSMSYINSSITVAAVIGFALIGIYVFALVVNIIGCAQAFRGKFFKLPLQYKFFK